MGPPGRIITARKLFLAGSNSSPFALGRMRRCKGACGLSSQTYAANKSVNAAINKYISK